MWTTTGSWRQVPKSEGSDRQSVPRGVPIVEVTRSYHFSAAHRMHNPVLSAEENARIYGRCNHANGHGHTYRLEVTVQGHISPETGWVVNGAELDDTVSTHVLQRFDRMNLDRLITPADGPTSTTEVLAGMIWRLLDEALPVGHLCRLLIQETPNNLFALVRGARLEAAGDHRGGDGARKRAESHGTSGEGPAERAGRGPIP
jgi:6-pyruvoyltetrahydropterin/6-carboxytetrahydropterin synthase